MRPGGNRRLAQRQLDDAFIAVPPTPKAVKEWRRMRASKTATICHCDTLAWRCIAVRAVEGT